MEDQKNLVTTECNRQVINIEDYAMPVERLLAQVDIIQKVMRSVMKEGEHYGTIPGTNKPSLWKPGAEKLGVTFRIVPSYDVQVIEMQNGHREYRVKCSLTHAPTGQFFGEGVGSCSTMESKYRYRKAEQACPDCGKETIIKGKKEYGGGWLCYSKKGGCGTKFKDGDPRIENQNMGRVEYSDPADYYNTVLKMGKKRAQVDAILTATAASDIFTQDIEDMVDNGTIEPKPSNHKTVPPTSGTSTDVGIIDMSVVEAAIKGCLTIQDLTAYMNENQKRFANKSLATKLFKDQMAVLKAGPVKTEVMVKCPDGGEVSEDQCNTKCTSRDGCPSWPEREPGED